MAAELPAARTSSAASTCRRRSTRRPGTPRRSRARSAPRQRRPARSSSRTGSARTWSTSWRGAATGSRSGRLVVGPAVRGGPRPGDRRAVRRGQPPRDAGVRRRSLSLATVRIRTDTGNRGGRAQFRAGARRPVASPPALDHPAGRRAGRRGRRVPGPARGRRDGERPAGRRAHAVRADPYRPRPDPGHLPAAGRPRTRTGRRADPRRRPAAGRARRRHRPAGTTADPYRPGRRGRARPRRRDHDRGAAQPLPAAVPGRGGRTGAARRLRWDRCWTSFRCGTGACWPRTAATRTAPGRAR